MLEGQTELMAKMKKLAEVGEHKAIGDATIEGARFIRNRAKVRAALMTKKKTGLLQKAIKAKRGRGRNKGTATVDVDRKIAPHSHLIEFGTGPRYTKSGKYVGQISARPYFRPVVDESKGRVARIVSRGIKEAIERIAR